MSEPWKEGDRAKVFPTGRAWPVYLGYLQVACLMSDGERNGEKGWRISIDMQGKQVTGHVPEAWLQPITESDNRHFFNQGISHAS